MAKGYVNQNRATIKIDNLADVIRQFNELSPENPAMKRMAADMLREAMEPLNEKAKQAVPSLMNNEYGGRDALIRNMKAGSRQARRKGLIATGFVGANDVTYSVNGNRKTFSIQSLNFGQAVKRTTRAGRNTGRIGSNKHAYRHNWYTQIVKNEIPSLVSKVERGMMDIINKVT